MPTEIQATIQQLFDNSTSRFPAAQAVVAQNKSLTYVELDEKTNQLAHYLQQQGVGRGTLVAIHLERSLELIIAVLAVLKAGAAYLPLPTDQPTERLLFILQDAAPVALITTHALRHFTIADLPIIEIDNLNLSSKTTQLTLPTSQPEDLAFCIYTSGSTGTPKGVIVTHRGIAALLAAQIEWFDLQPTDRVLQFASFGFDAFVFELVMAFGVGACLVLRGNDLGPALVDEMSAQAITIATLPPALLAKTDLQHLSSLRCVISAGEACQPALRKSLPPNCVLINAYGPTEATIWASSYRVDDAIEGTVPIGKAVASAQLMILDEQQNPVEDGATGEICIAGLGLAQAYVQRPALTAEKFLPNPFGLPGSRLYRTGDLGRLLADGNIEFLGRIDFQVKLRGFRIELGEIENVLCRHPAVREALVLLREDTPGEKRLVAYLVAQNADGIPLDDLRIEVQSSLPDYMMPSAWVTLASLPLNPNGKIDRRALPAPLSSRDHVGIPYVKPSTVLEQQLCDIWSAVLKIENIGIHDGFRTLGGSSMDAVEVAFRSQQTIAGVHRLPAPLGNITLAEYAQKVEGCLSQDQVETQIISHRAQPASFAQEQVSFLEQIGEAWRAYRCHARFLVRGNLQMPALLNALNALLARHEILRTSFHLVDGHVQRRVASQMPIAFVLHDLSALSTAEREKQFAAAVHEELNARFDVSQAPLVRWRLFKFAEDEHILYQSEHHHIHDGLSFRLLVRDLAECYNAFCQQRTIQLPQIEAQYGEFCLEEAAWLASADFQRQLDAWGEQLRDFRENTRLFSAQRKPGEGRFLGSQLRRPLPLAVLNKVNQLAAEMGVSRYVFMLSAFVVLCAKYSQQQKFLIGSALANRNAAKFQATVGMFVNMVPLAVDVQPELSFATLVQAISKMTDFALSHSAVPLVEIVKKLGLAQALQGDAPFNVGFSFHDSMKAVPDFSGLEVLVEEALPNGSAKFDLGVVGILHNASSTAAAELIYEYNCDVFELATIERMAEHFQQFLEMVSTQPDSKIKDLSLLSHTQYQQIVLEWNANATPLPKHSSIQQMFEAQVNATPDAIALYFEDQQLTYGELNQRANQLAHFLLVLGVKPGVLVAICVERSVEMIVGLLAILKSSAAYVPLDPAYPTERLAFMLADTACSVLLTQAVLLDRMPPHTAHSVCLDRDWAGIESYASDNPALRNLPHHPAYCIYTSGSTGKPKGALNTHAGFINLLTWYFSDRVRTTAQERVLLVSSLSFDLTQKNIFGPLTHGASLIVPSGNTTDVDNLRIAIEQNRPSRLNCAPSAFRAYQEIASLNSLSCVVLGGEVIESTLANELSVQGITLVNSYGPTECADVALSFLQAPGSHSDLVPIGRPIPNVQVFILDEHLQPQALGIAGEIYIAGVGIGLGYLNRPDLSAEKFLPNPFGQAGSRMYRTGDLGRHLADGNIEFLGRIDQQVKIRGFRIELGEIEHALRLCLGVQDVVVIAQGPTSASQQLVAYIVAKPNQTWQAAQLKTQLQRHLPVHMVPECFMSIQAIPLNPNGKLDRKALPPADFSPTVPPVTPLAENRENQEMVLQVLQMLNALMPNAALQAHDDLFSRGLQSIIMMRFAAQCRERFGVKLKVRELYTLTTALEIADVIQSRRVAQ